MRFIGLLPPALLSIIDLFVITAAGFTAVKPMGYLVLALLWASGILLVKKKWNGCLFGMIAGVIMIWLGVQTDADLIQEWPAGVFNLLFYMLAGYVVNMHYSSKNI